MIDDPIEITFLVITALEELQIRYLVAGSMASSIYGDPRSTRDADLLADIKPEHVERLCQLLQSQFNIPEESVINAIKYRSSFNAIHYDSVFKIDVFIPRSEFDEQELHRRVKHALGVNSERVAYIATPEDVVVAKLNWYRQGNEVSEQQWRDVNKIIEVNRGKLDVDYMLLAASQLNVLDLLQRLLPKE
jgi:hypothetical protein